MAGRNVYMSDIYDVLEARKYDTSLKWDRKKEFHIYIKADTFYCDEREKRSSEVGSIPTF